MLLTATGSGGDESAYDASFWPWPIPSPGALIVVVACEALGVAETNVSIDADAIIAASGEALELWPWTPPQPFEPAEPSREDFPAGGWFADAVAEPTDHG